MSLLVIHSHFCERANWRAPLSRICNSAGYMKVLKASQLYARRFLTLCQSPLRCDLQRVRNDKAVITRDRKNENPPTPLKMIHEWADFHFFPYTHQKPLSSRGSFFRSEARKNDPRDLPAGCCEVGREGLATPSHRDPFPSLRLGSPPALLAAKPDSKPEIRNWHQRIIALPDSKFEIHNS